MGRGIGIGAWDRTFPEDTDKNLYNKFMENLDYQIDELKTGNVRFGNLEHNIDDNLIQLWGANTKNYDTIASKGNRISGEGQARFLGNHTKSTFGIITSPSYGTPSLANGDFDKKRLCSRNPTIGPMTMSPGGGAAATTTPTPTKVKSILSKPLPSRPDDWECSICTFMNPPRFKECQMCKFPREEIETSTTTPGGGAAAAKKILKKNLEL